MCVKGEQNLLLSDTTQLQNRYQLKNRLGANGGKQTWLAEDLATHTKVTVKALYFGQGMEWQDLKLFEREAQTLKSLTHPNIPRYCDSFWLEKPEGNYFCLVQAYIPGISLAQKVSSGWRLEEGEIARVATSILEILVYLHRQNPQVVHRDIKPNNLIWGEDDQIYLVDFGAVQAEVTSGRTMTVVGTYGYMPPEQFGGRTVPASDLYGLGTTLLFLLTGTNPGDLPQKGLQLQFQEFIQADQPLKQWLKRMVEPSLDRRFQNAEEALVLLNMRDSLSSMETAQVNTYGRLLPSLVQLEGTSEQLNIEVCGFNSDDPTRKTKAARVTAGISSIISLVVLVVNVPFINALIFVPQQFGWIGLLGSIIVSSLIFAGLHTALNVIYWAILLRTWPVQVRTRIHLDRDTYTIIWDLDLKGWLPGLGAIPLYRVKALTQDLVGAEIESKFQDDELEVCVLQSKTKQYSFGLGLNFAERKWLVGEIQDWLKQSATGA
jgi:serine/threonine protein kinase